LLPFNFRREFTDGCIHIGSGEQVFFQPYTITGHFNMQVRGQEGDHHIRFADVTGSFFRGVDIE
jgi:hypothetical protein